MDKHHMTIPDLLRYLHQEAIARLSKNDEQALSWLGTTLIELGEAARYYHNYDVYDILDDLMYPVNETLMGAPGKAAGALDDVENKINSLERRNLQ